MANGNGKTWKDYAAQIITISVLLVGGAVAWGAVRTNVTANTDHLEKHDTKFDVAQLERAALSDRVSKSEARQELVIDGQKEIKADIKAILKMLRRR